MLRDYTLLADGERGAVLGPRGDIVWMCTPRRDSDAVFAALLGGPGGYSVTAGGPVRLGRLLRRGQHDLAQPPGACGAAGAPGSTRPVDPHNGLIAGLLVPAGGQVLPSRSRCMPAEERTTARTKLWSCAGL